jgi:hypothetical protein
MVSDGNFLKTFDFQNISLIVRRRKLLPNAIQSLIQTAHIMNINIGIFVNINKLYFLGV